MKLKVNVGKKKKQTKPDKSAKSKKSKTKAVSKDAAPTPKPIKLKVYQGGMCVPNHMVSPLLYPEDAKDLSSHDNIKRRKFVTLELRIPETKGSGYAKSLAFVDDKYNCRKTFDRQDVDPESLTKLEAKNLTYDRIPPPTWMDPEIFVRMVLAKQKEVAAAVKQITKSGVDDCSRLKELKPITKLCNSVLDSEYVPYMKEKAKRAFPVLAEWIVSHEYDKSAANREAVLGAKLKKKAAALEKLDKSKKGAKLKNEKSGKVRIGKKAKKAKVKAKASKR